MNSDTIERGWTVYTEDNKRAGDVVEAHPHYLLVSRGLLMVRDIYVPRYAVASVEDRKVRLAITDERLRRMGWTAPPPPPPPSLDDDDSTPRLVPPVESDPSASAPMSLFTTEETAPDIGDSAESGNALEGAFNPDDYGDFGGYEPLDNDYADLGVLFGPSIEVDGEAHLAAQRLGEGPPIVFIHGWGFDRRVWDYLTLDLPADYTVVTFDARGYGRSTAPWGDYDVARLSRDLRVLLRTLDLEGATLVGLDLGAAVALHYVLSGGQRAARLMLIAPAVIANDGSPTALADDGSPTALADDGSPTALADDNSPDNATDDSIPDDGTDAADAVMGAGDAGPVESPGSAGVSPVPDIIGEQRSETPALPVVSTDFSQTLPGDDADDATVNDAAMDVDAGDAAMDVDTNDAVGGGATVRQEPLWGWRDALKADRPRLAGQLAALWAPDASEETRAWLRDGLLEAAPHALLRGLGALAMPDVEGSYAEVRIPTMVLCGHADSLVSFEEAAALARAIPGATFTPLNTPGHLPMLADPEGLTALLRAFIEGESNGLTNTEDTSMEQQGVTDQ